MSVRRSGVLVLEPVVRELLGLPPRGGSITLICLVPKTCLMMKVMTTQFSLGNASDPRLADLVQVRLGNCFADPEDLILTW